MAYTTLALQEAPQGVGLINATYTAWPGAGAGNGFRIINDGNVVVHVKNVAAGGNATITIDAPRTPAGLALVDPTVVIPDGEEAFIPLGSPQFWNREGGTDPNMVYLDSDEITGLTAAAVHLS